jgi:ATP-binding cassette, subfamily B, bacterial MsbA
MSYRSRSSRVDKSNFQIVLRILRPYAWSVPVVVGLGLLASLSEGLGIGLLIPFLDAFLRGEQATGVSGPLVDFVQRYAASFDEDMRVVAVAATIMGLVFLKAGITVANVAIAESTMARIAHVLRLALFRQLVTVSLGHLTQRPAGEIVNTLDSQSWRTTDAMNLLFYLIINACTVIVFTILLFLLSWQLALTVTLAAVVVSFGVRELSRRAQRAGERAVATSHILSQILLDALDGMRVIRAYGQEAREQRRFENASERVRRDYLRVAILGGLVGPIIEIMYVPLFLSAVIAAWYVEVGLPTLIAFLLLLYRMQPHIKGLDRNRVDLMAAAASVAAVARFLDTRDKPYTRSGSQPFGGLQRDIVLDRVSFRYPGTAAGARALDDVSMRIIKGEVLAIVGGTGAGKSTLVNLLCRFYEPECGRILVDGRPLEDLDLLDWRNRLAIAGQDADLVSGTVRENIFFGQPDASEAEIVAAARWADAHAFIEALPDGYDTLVGQRGLRLSGGQRQRIGLARAFLRQPDMLILDEATNALDSLSETAILEMLASQGEQRPTTIVIAHRLSTIRDADYVIVMSEGRVVEQGRPRDLFDAEGMFTRLCELQLQDLRA